MTLASCRVGRLRCARLAVVSEIVVVVPVLGRPQKAAVVAESHEAARRFPSWLVFVCSPDDEDQIQACRRATRWENGGGDVLIADFPPGPGDFARKVNLAYRATSQPWIFQAADDVLFDPGWDTALLAKAEATGALVVGTQDCGNPSVKRGEHSTHTLIARSYIDDPGASMDGPGSVFSEAYGHQYCDVELVELAKARGVWAFAHDAIVRHEHPFWVGRDRLDETYRRGMAQSRADARVYAQRRRLWRGLRSRA